MGAFKTQKLIFGIGSVDIDKVISDVTQAFEVKGYTVESESLANGGAHISLTNSNIFKMVLGLKTALNVELEPIHENWQVNAEVGIFGQQAIPTMIMLFVAWPVLITQITGLIKQSKLDDEVVQEIENSLKRNKAGQDGIAAKNENVTPAEAGLFCSQCGAKSDSASKFCSQCGAKL